MIRSTAMLTVLLAGAVLLPGTEGLAEMERPEGWSSLPKKERPNVWVIDLAYDPEPAPQSNLQGRSVTLLPLIDSTLLYPPSRCPTTPSRRRWC